MSNSMTRADNLTWLVYGQTMLAMTAGVFVPVNLDTNELGPASDALEELGLVNAASILRTIIEANKVQE